LLLLIKLILKTGAFYPKNQVFLAWKKAFTFCIKDCNFVGFGNHTLIFPANKENGG